MRLMDAYTMHLQSMRFFSRGIRQYIRREKGARVALSRSFEAHSDD